jgi:hypothetical protein
LHVATFTSLAFIIDPLLLMSLWWGTEDWDPVNRRYAFWAQFIFMFGFTKVVKLLGLFTRNPSDIMFLPVSMLFGYFHGLIKLYALFTLKIVSVSLSRSCRPPPLPELTLCIQTSWGSRADGDEHNNFRLQERPKRSLSMTTPQGPQLELIRFSAKRSQRRMTLPSQLAPSKLPTPVFMLPDLPEKIPFPQSNMIMVGEVF